MRRLQWLTMVCIATLAACDDPAAPRASEGSALEPDGATASAGAASPVVARATGSAQRDALDQPALLNFHVAKHEDGTVDGGFYFRAIGTDPDQVIHVRATCMTVLDGNKAWISGVVEEAFLPALVGRFASFHTVDNGEGANAEPDIVTRVAIDATPGADVAFCDATPQVLPPMQTVRGNVQIRS